MKEHKAVGVNETKMRLLISSASPQPKQELSDSQKIVVPCKKAGIGPKEFADFFNISSDDLESVKNAIARFDDMAELKSKNANSQTVN